MKKIWLRNGAVDTHIGTKKKVLSMYRAKVGAYVITTLIGTLKVTVTPHGTPTRNIEIRDSNQGPWSAKGTVRQ